MERKINKKLYLKGVAEDLLTLWKLSTSKRRKQFLALIVFSLLNTLAELASIGSVIPFLILFSNPSKIYEYPFVMSVLNFFTNFFPNFNFFQIFTFFFISLIIFSSILRLFFLRLSLMISYSSASDLSLKIYKNIINQPYTYHLKLKTSSIITALTNKINVVAFHIIQSVFVSISSFLIVFGFLIGIFLYNPYIASCLLAFFIIFYFSIGFIFQNKLIQNSFDIERLLDRLVKLVQESLGSIKEIILGNLQQGLIDHYMQLDKSMRNVQSYNSFIGSAPRILIESIGVIVLLFLAFFLNQSGQAITEFLPILGLIIYSSQKVLPSIHSLFSAWSNIKGEHATLRNVIKLLENNDFKFKHDFEGHEDLKFNYQIKFKNISFSYENSSTIILDKINITIKKGSKVAILGASGSGKSTFVNILMALQKPSVGEIFVDSQPLTGDRIYNWRRKIAHVPQDVFLLNASIAENVAFGVPLEKINLGKVSRILNQLGFKDFIETLEKKLLSEVGERGINLSGGQRQKIAIARALYRKASLLVFDEATSSLDSKSQDDILKVIFSLPKKITVIMITHQTELTKNFDKIYMLKNKIFSQIN